MTKGNGLPSAAVYTGGLTLEAQTQGQKEFLCLSYGRSKAQPASSRGLKMELILFLVFQHNFCFDPPFPYVDGKVST